MASLLLQDSIYPNTFIFSQSATNWKWMLQSGKNKHIYCRVCRLLVRMDSTVPRVGAVPLHAYKCPYGYIVQNCGLMLQPCSQYVASIACRSKDRYIPWSGLLKPCLRYWALFNWRITRVVGVWNTWREWRGWGKWVCLVWRKEDCEFALHQANLISHFKFSPAERIL